MSNASHTTKNPPTRIAQGPPATVAGVFATLACLLRVPGRGTPSYRPLALCAAVVAALGALWLPAAAQAKIDVTDFDVAFLDSEGQTVSQAGAHPDEIDVYFEFASHPTGEGGEVIEEAPRDILTTLMEGFVGNPTAAPTCTTVDFLTTKVIGAGDTVSSCPDATAVGIVEVGIGAPKGTGTFYGAVHNLAPPPGVAAKLGFWIKGVPVSVELGVEETPPYRITGGATNTSQLVEVISSTFKLWGVPADPSHDALRGACLDPTFGTSLGKCPANLSPVPFLTVPRTCKGPLESLFKVDSWPNPGLYDEGSALTHNSLGEPEGFKGCGKLLFDPEVDVRPTTSSAESASGLDLEIEVEDEGLQNPDGLAEADIAASEVRLPAGVTINPGAAEGLGVCTEDQFDSASLERQGCPDASKLGTLEVTSPLLEGRVLRGAFYQAEQNDNPFGSLLAAYLTIEEPERGAFFKLPAKIETDPESGQIVTTVTDMPQWPIGTVKVHLRSGPRAPLVTPPSCGTYATEVKLTPSSGATPLEIDSPFEIESGPGGSPCPSGSPPFAPGFEAGSISNAAARYSPFAMRLTRADGSQDITKLSAVLPPGVTARLAGIPWCPDAQIAAAASRDGKDELASPSCPAASKLGEILAGAGVGTALTWAKGSLYLSGPYNGAPLSVVAIVPAVAGPFDVGTVVTRVGLRLNPKTGRGEVDGAASDPIPHILEGVPLKVREIRVLADRPDFTLNPTNCEESSTFATIWGGGSNPFSAADDLPFGAASRYQAASCASLAFEPKLAIKLFGGVRRGAHPALRAVVTPKPGQANFDRAVVTLPRSAFLDQAHIRTICTRVQFAAGPGHGALCPKGAQYGYARAWSPLLDGPAVGPVYLRSSTNKLPDLVVALKGPASAPVEIELSARIDSVKGGIRSTFTGIPDAPVSRFILDMQGAKKGLIVNSRNLCHKPKRNRARANIRGQNGRFSRTRPRVIATKCQQRRKAKRKRAKRSSGHVARASRVG